MKLNFVCPMCGEKTLDTQGEVVWCTNLDAREGGRPCQYGLGTEEKTIECLSVAEMALAAKLTEHEHFMGNCAGGFPLLSIQPQCRFCGADYRDKCKRVTA